jgi:hypothetical protein
VKNTFEFVDKINDVHIMPYDKLVTFYEALELLKKWLEEKHPNPDVLTQ